MGSVFISESQRIFCLIFQDRFWSVCVILACMVKLQLFAQCLADHLLHPIIPALILFLCQFSAFTYVVDRILSFNTSPILAILISILALMSLVLMTLFSVAVNVYSVSLIRFLLCGNVFSLFSEVSMLLYFFPFSFP